MLDYPVLVGIDNKLAIVVLHQANNFSAATCREQVSINEMMLSALYYINTISWIFIIVLVH